MKFSFIIPLYNDESSIGACLVAIHSEINECDEIFVIDNGSKDKSIEVVKKFRKAILLQQPNGTIGKIRNIGALNSKGTILAFIDADCIICPGWRTQVIRTMQKKEVVACGSKYDVPPHCSWVERAWFSQRIRKAGVTNYINSGNLSIKREIFFKIGGFNDSLITGEDTELCWRIRKAGYVIWEDPRINAVHLGNPKDIFSFYKKQRWQALGMFGTFKISRFDKPLLMTILFLFCAVLSFSILLSTHKNAGILAFFVIIFVPLLAAGYRTLQYRNYRYFSAMIILYLVYFFARLVALSKIIFIWITGGAKL